MVAPHSEPLKIEFDVTQPDVREAIEQSKHPKSMLDSAGSIMDRYNEELFAERGLPPLGHISAEVSSLRKLLKEVFERFEPIESFLKSAEKGQISDDLWDVIFSCLSVLRLACTTTASTAFLTRLLSQIEDMDEELVEGENEISIPFNVPIPDYPDEEQLDD